MGVVPAETHQKLGVVVLRAPLLIFLEMTTATDTENVPGRREKSEVLVQKTVRAPLRANLARLGHQFREHAAGLML